MQHGWQVVGWALACGAMVGAHAQGTVTVSGTVDLAARQVNNEGVDAQKTVVSGSNATSRLTFSGREDLGNGLAASFHLEHGLQAQSGAAASSDKFWDRRSTVSLSATPWGELRLGRDYVPTYSNWSRYDPFGYVGVARSANLVSSSPSGPIKAAFGSNANTTVRADNTVQWLMPSGWGGLEGGIMLAPSQGGDVAAGRAKVVAARVGYAAKGWNVSAATASSENSQTTAGSFKDMAFGGAYTLDKLRLSAAVREFSYDQATQSLTLLGATATWGPHEIKASWVRSNMSGSVAGTAIDTADATQLGLGYVYHLSKNTALYSSLAQISNGDGAKLVIPDGSSGMALGGRSKGFELGMRQRF